MKRILITYATMAGSTAEVAQRIGEQLSKAGLEACVKPISAVPSLDGYDGVVVGAPMIMGWHREAVGFLRKHRAELQQMPLAVFVMAMSLTDTRETSVSGLPVYVDPALPKPPLVAGKLTFRERYARTSNYVQPILNAARPAKPVSIGLFGGRLEYGRLPWWGVLFVMLVIQAPPADRRNWDAVQSWAAKLPAALSVEPEKVFA